MAASISSGNGGGKSGHREINGPANNRGAGSRGSVYGKCNRKDTAWGMAVGMGFVLCQLSSVLSKGEMVE